MRREKKRLFEFDIILPDTQLLRWFCARCNCVLAHRSADSGGKIILIYEREYMVSELIVVVVKDDPCRS